MVGPVEYSPKDIDFIDQFIQRTKLIERFGQYDPDKKMHDGDYDYAFFSLAEMFKPILIYKISKRLIESKPELALTICSKDNFRFIGSYTKHSLKNVAINNDSTLTDDLNMITYIDDDDDLRSGLPLVDQTSSIFTRIKQYFFG